MPSVTVPLGAPTTITDRAFRWNPPTGSLPDISVLTAVPGENRFLEEFEIDVFAQLSRVTCSLFANLNNVSGFEGASRELLASFETFERAVVFAAGDYSLELPGPNYSGNARRDDSEHYRWRPDSTPELLASITEYRNLSGAIKATTTLTLRDEIPAPPPPDPDPPPEPPPDPEPTPGVYIDTLRKVASPKPLVRLRNSINADGAVVQEHVLDESAVEITVVHQAISFAELNQLRAWVKANRTNQVKIVAIDGIEYNCVLGSVNVPYVQNNHRVNATIRLYGNAV